MSIDGCVLVYLIKFITKAHKTLKNQRDRERWQKNPQLELIVNDFYLLVGTQAASLLNRYLMQVALPG